MNRLVAEPSEARSIFSDMSMSSGGISKPVNVLTRNGTVRDESNAAAAAVQLLYSPLVAHCNPALYSYLRPKISGCFLKPLPGRDIMVRFWITNCGVSYQTQTMMIFHWAADKEQAFCLGNSFPASLIADTH